MATMERRRFSVDDYYRMAAEGVLGSQERVELIDGEVVVMSPIGPRHAACVTSATRELLRVVGDIALVRPGNPVRLNTFNEPQPDFTVVRPRADLYASSHPGPTDVMLVVEISDSSLAYDRGVKARLYAQWGLVEYWLADLNAERVWIYSSPEDGTYQTVEERQPGEALAPSLLPGCVVSVDAFLLASNPI